MCRLRRHGLPGPAPAGGPTSCAPKKSAEEGRSRGLPPVPLRNPREYLASTRRLPSLPTGTPAEGSIQVAGAPNTGTEGSATKERRPPGGAPLRFCRRISPKAFRTRFRRLTGRGIAPAARRLAGCCKLVRSSVTGRRRLWPQANRRRRGGRRGEAPRALLWFLSWASKKGTRCRSTTDKLYRSLSGEPKPAVGRQPAAPPLPERQI